MFEAFKAGLIDYRIEDDADRWRNGYDFPAAKDGRVIKAAIPSGLPKGVSGFAFNTRRPMFADPRVREALASMFDFEWINANLFAGAYKRSEGSSTTASCRRSAVRRRRASGRCSRRFQAAVRDDVMEGRWRAPVSDGSGRDRAIASSALERTGSALAIRCATDASSTRNDAPLAFEILVKNREEERLALAYARNLARIGVTADVRLVDEVQFQRRRTRFDFDMMIGTWIASPSPGNEQRGRWSSAAADAEGAYNIAGAASPAVDAMIAAILAADSERGFRRRGAGARSPADLGLLHRPALLCARTVDRLFGEARPAGEDAAVRRRSRRLVADRALTDDRARIPLTGEAVGVRSRCGRRRSDVAMPEQGMKHLTEISDLHHRVRRLRWFRETFSEQADEIGRCFHFRYKIDDRTLVDAFFRWAEAFERQRRELGKNWRDFAIFAAGLMLRELCRSNPARKVGEGQFYNLIPPEPMARGL